MMVEFLGGMLLMLVTSTPMADGEVLDCSEIKMKKSEKRGWMK